MKEILVSAGKPYSVYIDSGIRNRLDQYLLTCGSYTKACIVSDENVWPLYGKSIESVLFRAGIETCHFVIPAGEESKNGANFLSLLQFLAENAMTRCDVLIALGGGVVGDLTGFTAATYLRGIDYIQFPTSLLAMVDSSVGGKTAIDLPAGKNLAGAFYQPRFVLCDLSILETLPQDVFLDGCGEIIKYGALFDDALFSHLEENGIRFDRESVISRCVELKRDIVAEDEYDRGVRQLLNFGHTVGHAVECASNYTVSHGRAVSIGMCIASKIAEKTGLCDTGVYDRIKKTAVKFDLPTITPYSAQILTGYMQKDKKRQGGTINLILPQKIGHCVIRTIPVSDLTVTLEMGLSL